MNNTRRTYLLTLNSPSQRALRLWTGKSIHTLRHCSVKGIGGALIEMQKSLDDLQKSMRTLRFSGHHKGRVSTEVREATIGQKNRRGPFFRNISQKGDPHGGKGRGRSRS